MYNQRMYAIPKMEKSHFKPRNKFSRAEQPVTNKLVNWILGKVFNYMMDKGYLYTEFETVSDWGMEHVQIDLDQLDNQIAHQKDIIDMVYGDRVDTLICGRDVMHKIMHGGDPMRMGQVEFRYAKESRYASYSHMNEHNEHQRQHVYYNNLRVILVPWFEGFLVIRRDEV